MADYTLRNVKGSKLTTTEADNNFIASRDTARCNGCMIITPPSGNYVTQAFSSGSLSSTVSVGADTIVISPFVLGYDLTVDQAGGWQSSSSSINLRILIYSSTASGLPNTKLAETATITTSSDSSFSTSFSHTFTANTLYYVGVHTGGSASFRRIGREALMPLGGIDITTGDVPCAITLSSTALGSAPDTWSFATSQLLSVSGVPFVGFRAA